MNQKQKLEIAKRIAMSKGYEKGTAVGYGQGRAEEKAIWMLAIVHLDGNQRRKVLATRKALTNK